MLIPVTSADGERVYCQLLDDEIDQEVSRQARSNKVQLLSRPISALLEEVEYDATAAVLRETAREHDAAARQEVMLRLAERCRW